MTGAELKYRSDIGSGLVARESAELLQRLLRAGLSRYEPTPLQALEQVEKQRAAK